MSEGKKYGSLAFVGRILIFMGSGLAFNRPDMGSIIGVGFPLMVIINAKTQKKTMKLAFFTSSAQSVLMITPI